MMIVNPNLYWLVWLSVGFLGVGFALGLLLIFSVGTKARPTSSPAGYGSAKKGMNELFDILFHQSSASHRLVGAAMGTCLAIGILSIAVLLPLLN